MAKSIPAGVVDQTHLATQVCQSHVGVVFSELQAKLGAASEHAVRLGHAFGGEVIYQHAQVSDVSAWRPSAAHIVGQAFYLATLKRGVDSSEQALGRRLFVSCSAVDLPRKEQASDRARLETALEFARVEVIVFNGVAGANNMRILQALHGADQLVLDIKRQAGRDAVRVVLVGGQPLGL